MATPFHHVHHYLKVSAIIRIYCFILNEVGDEFKEFAKKTATANNLNRKEKCQNIRHTVKKSYRPKIRIWIKRGIQTSKIRFLGNVLWDQTYNFHYVKPFPGNRFDWIQTSVSNSSSYFPYCFPNNVWNKKKKVSSLDPCLPLAYTWTCHLKILTNLICFKGECVRLG